MKLNNFQKIIDNTPPEVRKRVEEYLDALDKQNEADELLKKTWYTWTGDEITSVQSNMTDIGEYLKKHKLI